MRLRIDKAAFDVHKYLLKHYNFRTDIVFSRPNYCKVDLMVGMDREDKLYLQNDEIGKVQAATDAWLHRRVGRTSGTGT